MALMLTAVLIIWRNYGESLIELSLIDPSARIAYVASDSVGFCAFSRCVNARKLRQREKRRKGGGERRESFLPLPSPPPSSVSFPLVPISARSKSENAQNPNGRACYEN